jgi:hypothetical protein
VRLLVQGLWLGLEDSSIHVTADVRIDSAQGVIHQNNVGVKADGAGNVFSLCFWPPKMVMPRSPISVMSLLGSPRSRELLP